MNDQNSKTLPQQNSIFIKFKNPRIFLVLFYNVCKEKMFTIYFFIFFSENFILVWWFELSLCYGKGCVYKPRMISSLKEGFALAKPVKMTQDVHHKKSSNIQMPGACVKISYFYLGAKPTVFLPPREKYITPLIMYFKFLL